MIRRAKKRLNCLHLRFKRATKRVFPPIAPRYVGLMWMSLMCLFVGLAYSPLTNVPANLPAFLKVATALLPAATDFWNPVWLFSLAWTTVGVVGLAGVMLRKRLELVYHLQVGLFAYWSFSYLAAWALGEPRAWVTGGIFLVFTGVTWSFTRVDPPFRGIWGRFQWTRQ